MFPIGTSATVQETSPGSGVWDITLHTTVTNQPTTFTIRGDIDDQLGRVIVDGDTPQIVQLAIRGNSAGTPLASVDEITLSLSNTATVVLTELRTTGDAGFIGVHSIAGADIGGDITVGIELPQPVGGGQSTITDLSVSGDILGDVIVEYGSIESLNVLGALGSTSPVDVRVQGNIFNLVAGAINADITTLANGGTGSVRWLETTSGDFTGSLATSYLSEIGTGQPAGITIDGDLGADLDFNNNVSAPITVDGSVPSTSTITVGQYLNGAGDITLGSLAGQVIINADNAAGTWVGDVRIGGPSGTVLSPVPFYTDDAATVGGGAVGLVPFNYHPVDGVPDDDATIYAAPAEPVEMWFYGPVKADPSAAGSPLRIEARSTKFANNPWVDVTDDFTVTVSGSGVSRKVEITKGPNNTWFGVMNEYRFLPVQANDAVNGFRRLLCADLNAEVPAHDGGADPYSFKFPLTSIPLDLSLNGTVDTPDAVIWMAEPVDYDGNGTAGAEDFQLIVDAIANGGEVPD